MPFEESRLRQMQHYLSSWITEFGDAALDTLEFTANNLDAAAKLMPDHDAGLKTTPPKGGSDGNLVVTGKSFSGLIEGHTGQSGVPYVFSLFLLRNLVASTVAIELPRGTFGSFALPINVLRTAIENGELYGAALGPEYFLQRKRASIIEIVVSDGGSNQFTGTGFVVHGDGGSKVMMQTCKHCLCDRNGVRHPKISLKSRDEEVSFGKIQACTRIDSALVEIEHSSHFERIVSRDGEVLTRVVTAGFPRLLRRNGNPLLYHSGEINGWVGDLETGTKMGITSAAVAPGNSGGPVFNSAGSVVGMISEKVETKGIAAGETEELSYAVDYNLFIPSDQISYELNAGNVEWLD